MGKIKDKKQITIVSIKGGEIDIDALRKNRIENLKTMINNEDYVNEAIVKLANSLIAGLMK